MKNYEIDCSVADVVRGRKGRVEGDAATSREILLIFFYRRLGDARRSIVLKCSTKRLSTSVTELVRDQLARHSLRAGGISPEIFPLTTVPRSIGFMLSCGVLWLFDHGQIDTPHVLGDSC